MYSEGDMVYVKKTKEKGMVIYCIPLTRRVRVDLDNSGKKEFWEDDIEMDFNAGKYKNY